MAPPAVTDPAIPREQRIAASAYLELLAQGLLDMAARVFLAPGRSTVFSQHAFAVYPLASLSVGAELIAVPAREFGHDLDAMRAAVRPDTRQIGRAHV